MIATGYALLLQQSPDDQRARTTALAGIGFNIIGGGLGPLAVALITDNVFADVQALPYSMALVGGFGSLLGVCILGFFRSSLKSDYSAA